MVPELALGQHVPARINQHQKLAGSLVLIDFLTSDFEFLLKGTIRTILKRQFEQLLCLTMVLQTLKLKNTAENQKAPTIISNNLDSR